MLSVARAAENLAIPTRLPFEVILRDMQTSLKPEGYWTVAARIWKTQGIAGFYKGWLSPVFMGFRSGIQQSIFDQLKGVRAATGQPHVHRKSATEQLCAARPHGHAFSWIC